MCTAIGVLGTFYGIQAGIGNIPLNNLDNTQSLLSGVAGLLEGMKTAFSTSLMGLGSGSLFTICLFVTDSIRQSQHDKLRKSLHKITVTKKDSRDDAVNSLKEIAASFRNFDFNANLRASQALERVAQNLDARIIGTEVRTKYSILPNTGTLSFIGLPIKYGKYDAKLGLPQPDYKKLNERQNQVQKWKRIINQLELEAKESSY